MSKYTSVSVTGYNASSPTDDGSATENNRLKWSKHKEKLGDPLKTALESINTNIVTALTTDAREITTAETLVASDHWKTIQCPAASAGVTISLGDAATMAAGYITTIVNTGVGNVTVDLDTATDLLNDTTNGTQVIPPDAALTFIVNPSADGYISRAGLNAIMKGGKTLDWDISGLTAVRKVTPPDYDTRIGNLPAGIGPLPYAGGTIPTGWLECDGSAVSRTTYAALFTAISTTWGAGDGSTTFNLPDMRGKAPIGAGTGTSVASGEDADVDTGTDRFTVDSNDTRWITGMAVVFTLSSGTITGLTSSNTYYVIRISTTQIQLASSRANAQNGTAIDLTAKSSPVWTLTHTYTARTLGEYGGEEAHAMSSTDLLSHTHIQDAHAHNLLERTGGTGSNRLAAGTVVDGSTSTSFSGPVVSATPTNQNTGGNAAMNIMNPFAVVKYIISY